MENKDKPINPVNGTQYETGLTKREYFAGLAMQGIIASGKGVATALSKNSKYADSVAKWSISYADELLKQLSDEK